MSDDENYIELNGCRYKLSKGGWISSNGMIPPIAAENELDSAVIDKLDKRELFKRAEKLKQGEKYHKATRFYEIFIDILGKNELKYAITSLATCYRKSGQPEKAIELAARIKSRYGPDFLSAAFMTLIGWSYLDMGDYISSRKCANIALKKLNGKSSLPLMQLYKTLNN